MTIRKFLIHVSVIILKLKNYEDENKHYYVFIAYDHNLGCVILLKIFKTDDKNKTINFAEFWEFYLKFKRHYTDIAMYNSDSISSFENYYVLFILVDNTKINQEIDPSLKTNNKIVWINKICSTSVDESEIENKNIKKESDFSWDEIPIYFRSLINWYIKYSSVKNFNPTIKFQTENILTLIE